MSGTPRMMGRIFTKEESTLFGFGSGRIAYL